MIALVFALFLAVSAPTCPLAAPLSATVSCPGWTTRTCRATKADGTLIRRSNVKGEFLKRYGYKGTTVPGQVIDHLFPLACGGCDVPWNFQLQTKVAGKAKDRWERDVCGKSGLNDPE